MTLLCDYLNDLIESGKQNKIGLDDGGQTWYAQTYRDEIGNATGGEEFLDQEVYFNGNLVYNDNHPIIFHIINGNWDEKTGDFVEN